MLRVWKIRSFKVLEIINHNALKINFLENISVYLAVHVEQTAHVYKKSSVISILREEEAVCFTDNCKDNVIKFSEMFSHRKRGQG